jgi:hypothetical protein
MSGRLKRYYGDEVYELIWLLKRAIPCQLAVEGILQEAVDVRREWHDNGQLRYEEEWKDGQRHGVHRHWNANGQLRYEDEWKDGQRHGLGRNWYMDGKFWYDGDWENWWLQPVRVGG